MNTPEPCVSCAFLYYDAVSEMYASYQGNVCSLISRIPKTVSVHATATGKVFPRKSGIRSSTRVERLYKEHVIKEVGRDVYYDPKEMDKRDIPKAYKAVVDWAKKSCPHLMKTGWDALR